MKLLKQRLTSPFGPRLHPKYGGKEFHTGVDLVDDKSHHVYCAYEGIIRRSKFGNFGEGNYVQMVSNIKGISLYHNYFHNEENLVKGYEDIERDQLIAIQGMTGTATGIHTHYEIFMMDNQLNEDFAKDLIKFVKNEKIGHRIFFEPFMLDRYFEKKGII
jgi:murein DD-endopeptidase MepM/ murein hydrolase activator NlpD